MATNAQSLSFLSALFPAGTLKAAQEAAAGFTIRREPADGRPLENRAFEVFPKGDSRLARIAETPAECLAIVAAFNEQARREKVGGYSSIGGPTACDYARACLGAALRLKGIDPAAVEYGAAIVPGSRRAVRLWVHTPARNLESLEWANYGIPGACLDLADSVADAMAAPVDPSEGMDMTTETITAGESVRIGGGIAESGMAPEAPAVESGPVGPDWQGMGKAAGFYAQEIGPNGPGRFAFGETEQAAREALAAVLAADLSDGGRAYAAECLADGATPADAIAAAREAEKRQAAADPAPEAPADLAADPAPEAPDDLAAAEYILTWAALTADRTEGPAAVPAPAALSVWNAAAMVAADAKARALGILAAGIEPMPGPRMAADLDSMAAAMEQDARAARAAVLAGLAAPFLPPTPEGPPIGKPWAGKRPGPEADAMAAGDAAAAMVALVRGRVARREADISGNPGRFYLAADLFRMAAESAESAGNPDAAQAADRAADLANADAWAARHGCGPEPATPAARGAMA